MKFTQEQNVSRRSVLGGVVVALGLVGTGAVKYMIENGHSLHDFLPDEKLTVVKKRKRVTSATSGEIIIPTAYIEFRGNVFELYPIKADVREIGPLSLVRRAHIMYNPGEELETPILKKAEDLFNYFNHRDGATLENVVEGEKTSLTFRALPTPIIKGNQPYIVPIVTPYKSIDEVVKSSKAAI